MSSPMEEERLRLERLCSAAAMELYGLCPKFSVGRPKNPKNGDLAASTALALGGALKRRPSEIAAEIARLVPLRDGERLEAGDGGFLNLYLSADFLRGLLGPRRELPEVELPEPSAPDFCRVHTYHRLRRLLELHGSAEGGDAAPLSAPEELRLLRAVAREEEPELTAAAEELYDRLGFGHGAVNGARSLLFNNALYLLYGLLGKEKL